MIRELIGKKPVKYLVCANYVVASLRSIEKLMALASARMSVSQSPAMEGLQTDERWQLVQRIVCSAPFQKSTRLRELLQYLVEQTLHGNAHELTEQHIGNALFRIGSERGRLSRAGGEQQCDGDRELPGHAHGADHNMER